MRELKFHFLENVRLRTLGAMLLGLKQEEEETLVYFITRFTNKIHRSSIAHNTYIGGLSSIAHNTYIHDGAQALLSLLVVGRETIDDSTKGTSKGQLIYCH